jgi:hypothetical protein
MPSFTPAIDFCGTTAACEAAGERASRRREIVGMRVISPTLREGRRRFG